MNGYNVFYPMGYDDNGLPTERYAERETGQTAAEMGHEAYVELCIALGESAGREYEALWKRLALSVDWRHTYRTIGTKAIRLSQFSFLDLLERGLVYRSDAPSIWCPECGTAIAQAELDDLERPTTFYTLAFHLQDGDTLPIATTRPELLPACVAVFVHPGDARFAGLAGQRAIVPQFGQRVPILQDPNADPAKGTGAVMCCTFGDVTDVMWWRTHDLPLVEAIGPDGTMTPAAQALKGLTVVAARKAVIADLRARDLLLAEEASTQSVRVHERCDTPIEHIMTQQWFLSILDARQELLDAGAQIRWHPPHMAARYRQWVENLSWDWCLSRQRHFGVPFPVWHCQACGEIIPADGGGLPVDPRLDEPPGPCPCGSQALAPDTDVMDTWATSSLTPQIAGRWLADPDLYRKIYPMSLRPQAHDIIRTWAFYTIVKSHYHFGTLPWTDIAISGWGIAGEGMGKISKSRGGGPVPPLEMIERYSADGIRYWAASTGLGKDAVISEGKIELGVRLADKLWNVARFSARFVAAPGEPALPPREALSPADRWILASAQRLVQRVTQYMTAYEHAAAKSEVESFFWTSLADNYIEMAKLRLYAEEDDVHSGASGTLAYTLLIVLKLFAPFLPHITEQIYRQLYATEARPSIHTSPWPVADPALEDDAYASLGDALIAIATAVRRFKSEHKLSLGAELSRVELATADRALADRLVEARGDLISVTRAQEIRVADQLTMPGIPAEGPIAVAVLH
jgi:valyl-tRNA synthetase